MDKYEIIIYWSEDDGAFIAKAPELPGCVAHGATHEKALASIREAMKLWIATAKELGHPIPQPKDIRELKGILARAGRKSPSVKQMNQAIRRRARRSA